VLSEGNRAFDEGDDLLPRRLLADQITLQMQNPPERSNASPLRIADELDKLEELRQRGVLTQGEFDQQKAKLLAQ
jgi:hypothetical protein